MSKRPFERLDLADPNAEVEVVYGTSDERAAGSRVPPPEELKARILELETALDAATRGLWRQDEIDAAKWRAQERAAKFNIGAGSSIPSPPTHALDCPSYRDWAGRDRCTCVPGARVPPPRENATEIELTRRRLERAIRAAVEHMPRYFGTYIDPRDFVEDGLLYALDQAVAADAVLQAEEALLGEVLALKARPFITNERAEILNARAERWLDSTPDQPYGDTESERLLDVQHHNEAYDLIEALLAAWRVAVVAAQEPEK